MNASGSAPAPQRRANAQPTMSVREMAHRINNTLAVVQAIINQTARLTGELPTRSSAYEDDFFKGDKAAEVQAWREYIKKHGFAPRYPEKYVEITQLIVDAVQEVIVRNVDPKEALDKAAARAKAMR